MATLYVFHPYAHPSHTTIPPPIVMFINIPKRNLILDFDCFFLVTGFFFCFVLMQDNNFTGARRERRMKNKKKKQEKNRKPMNSEKSTHNDYEFK